MIRDLYVPEDWERINDQFRDHLKVPADQVVKFYRGLGHAVYEATLGLSQLYSHKRSVGFVKGNDPYIEFVVPHYLREAYQMQAIDFFSLQQHHANWTEWAQTLKKDTVFVLACEDHPVTGELQDLSELDAALNDKKIFFLRISHSAHVFQSLEINPYTVRICSVNPKLAFVRSGAKYKVPPLLAPVMDWSAKEIQMALAQIENKKEFPKEVMHFEQTLKEFSFSWTGSRRLFDRSLLIFPEVTGDLISHSLSKSLGFAAATPVDLNLWSTHLCQWNSVKMFKTWWKNSPSEETLRDLLVINAEVIQRNGFAEALRKTYEELKSSQSWSF